MSFPVSRAAAAGLAIPAAVAVIIKLFCIEFLVISGSSMEPAIQDGTIAVICKNAYGLINPFSGAYIVHTSPPVAGDIVVYPYNGKYVVKRCIAVEGTSVSVKISDNGEYTMRVGAVELPVTQEQYRHFSSTQTVPPGMFFAAGDNSRESVDSRDYGFVSELDVRGKIIFAAGEKTHAK